jgi:hypothetical protein
MNLKKERWADRKGTVFKSKTYLIKKLFNFVA